MEETHTHGAKEDGHSGPALSSRHMTQTLNQDGASLPQRRSITQKEKKASVYYRMSDKPALAFTVKVL